MSVCAWGMSVYVCSHVYVYAQVVCAYLCVPTGARKMWFSLEGPAGPHELGHSHDPLWAGG
jgi:hypothetical protein